MLALSLILLQVNSRISRRTDVTYRDAGRPLRIYNGQLVMVMTIAAILPQLLRVIFYGINPYPDVKTYERDTQMILKEGFFAPEKLSQDPHYRSFPIFSLLNAILCLLLQTSFPLSYTILHLLSLSLYILLFLIMTRMLFRIALDRLRLLILITLLYSSNYFYIMWVGVLPISLGMIALLLSLTMFYKAFSYGKTSHIVMLLLYILGLVHAAIPLYILILTCLAIGEIGSSQSLRHIIRSLLLPIIVFTLYTSFSYLTLESLYHRIKLFAIYHGILQKSGFAILASELQHPVPALNAIGPSISVGITAAFFMMTIFNAMRGKFRELQQNIKMIFGLSVASLILLSLGGYYYIFEGATGLGNVRMYPMMYGYFLSYIVALNILWQIRWEDLINSSSLRKRLLSIIYLFILMVGAIGSLSDPFTFNLST